MTEERAAYIADAKLTRTLDELRGVVNGILHGWHGRQPPKGEPVNWAALYCHSAGVVLDYQNTMGFFVVVEEAAPDASGFQDWLGEQLVLSGWTNVEVVTEW